MIRLTLPNVGPRMRVLQLWLSLPFQLAYLKRLLVVAVVGRWVSNDRLLHCPLQAKLVLCNLPRVSPPLELAPW